MTDTQKFYLKIFAVMAVSLGGWFATLGTWAAGLTPLAMGGLLGILGSQIVGILGIVPPSAVRAVDIALLPGVHTQEEVAIVSKATAGGAIPTPMEAAAIIADIPTGVKP